MKREGAMLINIIIGFNNNTEYERERNGKSDGGDRKVSRETERDGSRESVGK